jgi:hypothetical protein
MKMNKCGYSDDHILECIRTSIPNVSSWSTSGTSYETNQNGVHMLLNQKKKKTKV